MRPEAEDTDILSARYKDLAMQQRNASRVGDYKQANKAYDKLKKIYDKLQEQGNEALAEKILTTYLKSGDIGVRLWAAAHCLGLNIYIEEAEKTLEEISKMKGIGIERHDAEMTLKVWKEKGYLRF